MISGDRGDAFDLSVHRGFLGVSLSRIVLEELFNEIYMCHNHPTATVTLATKLVHSIPVRYLSVDQLQVAFPQISYHLAARETSHWNYHFHK